MTERKMRRLVTVGTVVAVVVLFLMIVVLIVQMCALSARKRRLQNQRNNLIAAEEELKYNEALKAFYETDEGKIAWLLEHGYEYKGNE